MEGGALFNSGFLGASFSWWVGQIADDSTWRDNILPGKFESADQIPGWGRRFKVRIIGLHDQGETEIASDQLPWAQVMYPITAGGGQGSSGQTSNLRQGNMVFGFFLDGQEQQVPVIMGVLGNNAQTSLATKIGDGKVTNTQPGSLATSGFAEGKVPYPGAATGSSKPKAPDTGLVIKKPEAGKGATIENADAVHLQSNADTKRLDLYLKKSVLLSPCDITGSAMKGMQTEIESLTKEMDKILQSASSYVDAVSEVTSKVSDITRQVTSAAGAIGGAAGSIGAAAGQVDDSKEKIQALMEQYAPKIAKYMKVVFNKISEYTAKQVNKTLGPLVDIMYPNQRFQFFDIKLEVNELLVGLFDKITNNLSNQILGTLTDKLKNPKPSKDPPNPTQDNANPKGGTAPFVPICSVEELTGSVIAANMGDMDDTVATIITSVGTFLKDIRENQISGIEESASSALATITALAGSVDDIAGSVDDIAGSVSKMAKLISKITGGLPEIEIPDINASLVSALSFENISLDIFKSDLKPNCPVSDFYTLQEGAGAAEEAQLPRPAQVSKDTENPSTVTSTSQPDYASPSKDTQDLKIGETNNETQAAADAERQLAVQSLDLF
jgi:ABC-type transporter Mla subunit MlaD